MRNLAVLTALMVVMCSPVKAEELGCSASARSLSLACGFDNRDDYLVSVATCVDATSDTTDCLAEANEAFSESTEECREVSEARLDLCDSLDDAAHEPGFGEDFAENFVDPRQIGVSVDPNPWFPLVQGYVWVYEGTSPDEDTGEPVTETITVTVTNNIKLIDGVPCITVRDVVLEEGEFVEDTDDWYAQDIEGNVWYCGEISQNFEYFDGDEPEDPELVDLDGSWKAGRDGDKAGILFPLMPVVGQVIRQELSYTNAEDVIEILALDGNETSDVVSCDNACLVTRDFTPLEPGVDENKFFVRGVGLIVEVKPGTEERLALIEFNQ